MSRHTINGNRYDTDRMNDLGIKTRESHGVNIEGVYMMPRSRRVLVKTYSIWDRGDGRVVGYRLHEADVEEIADLAQEHEHEALWALVPDAADGPANA